jgi:non-ribosomal peptide synthetase component E (peptide arylation enzyme)
VDLARNLIGRINVVDQPPRTSIGKIQKNVVRSGHAAHYED